MARARQLLAVEGAYGGSAEVCAAAAGRVYDKLNTQLAPLLGPAGFRALVIHSSMLAQRDIVRATDVVVESSTKLRGYLQDLDLAIALRTSEALFGTFFALTTTFIGERLTIQALRSAWPTIEEAARTANEEESASESAIREPTPEVRMRD